MTGQQVSHYAIEAAESSENVWNLYARDLRTGDDRTLTNSDVFVHDPDFSPDSRYVAYEITHGNGAFGNGQDIRVMSLEGDRTWRLAPRGSRRGTQ